MAIVFGAGVVLFATGTLALLGEYVIGSDTEKVKRDVLVAGASLQRTGIGFMVVTIVMKILNI